MTQVLDQAAGTQQAQSYAADFRSGTAREPQRPRYRPGRQERILARQVWPIVRCGGKETGRPPSEEGGPGGGGKLYPSATIPVAAA